MSVELNHTIVIVQDRDAAAREVAETLGLGKPGSYGPFAVVELANGVSLDFMEHTGEIEGQHYAFLVSDEDFDAIRDGCATRRPVVGRPVPAQPRRDQHQRRWSRALLGRPRRPLAGDHHGAVRGG